MNEDLSFRTPDCSSFIQIPLTYKERVSSKKNKAICIALDVWISLKKSYLILNSMEDALTDSPRKLHGLVRDHLLDPGFGAFRGYRDSIPSTLASGNPT